ncbi:energy transducer TonB [Sphingomonas sp. S6]|jgi:TonB family protein|uniref:energy transducer TonB n=1 Tax=Sphingomonas sp. S6 TaxID=3368600 RepID=UPI000FA9AAE6|nr:energy transducer TonB [uncultured Sphingomonas sp.]RTL17370.1 MAG: energy transducer TonB [Sphingomonadaceae bacterium]
MMIGLVALALQAAAPSGGSIDAAGKWGVDYSPEQCIINRQFGSGPVKSFLAVDASPVTGTGNIVLLVPGVATKGTFGTATMTVAPGGATLQQMWFARGSKDARAAIDIGITQDGWAAIAAGDTLTIKGPFASPVSVPVKGIDKAIAAAKTCGRTLLQSWGADPDAMIDTSSPKSPGNWISYSDYPAEALRNGESGTVKILLTIDPKGRPRDCKVVASSRSPSLDATTCRIMTARATFEPSSRETRYVFKRTDWRVP